MKPNVNMKLAIGGKWCVTVVDSYLCMDLREWYYYLTTRYCTTTNRIQHVERDNSTVVQVPSSTDDDTVFVWTGSSKPGGSSYVSRMQSISIRRKVFFDTDNITVFAPIDWSHIDYSYAL